MGEDRKQQLLQLGAEALAEALLDLASRDQAANDLVERLTSTPGESLVRFKEKLSALRDSRRFTPWRESAGFARELENLLEHLKAGVADPRTGLELIADFYRADGAIFESCDDSSGHIGDVFQFDARNLFVDFAKRCEDKEWLAELALDLNRDDNYGVRDILIDCAAEYLPETQLRQMISRLQDMADGEEKDYQKRHWLLRIESLARQIKDASLFEKTRIASWGNLSTPAYVDIAQVYLESGDARTALSWLEKAPKEETFQAYEMDRLLLDIYGRVGEAEKQKEVAWRIFRGHRCAESLDELLAFIGKDQRNLVVENEVAAILGESILSLADAAFMVEVGHIDDAAIYLLDRADEIRGDFYGELLPLAEVMMAQGKTLIATIIYRALLNSILRRGQSKAYAHGASYLKKLDHLAEAVPAWQGIEDHAAYAARLRQQHSRKRSFWSQCK